MLNIRTRFRSRDELDAGSAPSKAVSAVAKLSGIAARETASDFRPSPCKCALCGCAGDVRGIDAEEASSVFYRLALAVEAVDLAAVMRDINEDRLVAGFPPVRDEGTVLERFEAKKSESAKPSMAYSSKLPAHRVDQLCSLAIQ